MSQSRRLIQTIKKILKQRGMNYAQLAKHLKVSEASIKRSFAQEAFTLQRIDDICEFLQMDFYELAKETKGLNQDMAGSFNQEQEKELSKDESLFIFFYLLAAGLTFKDIINDYKFTENQALAHLFKLDKLGLIELLSENRVKLTVSPNVRWLKNGPLAKIYEKDIKNEFLDSDFQGQWDKFRMLTGSFTANSMLMLNKKIERLLGDFLEFSELDIPSQENKTQLWFLLAIRPWSFSIVNKFKRK